MVKILHVTVMDSTAMGALLVGYNAAHAVGVEYEARDVAPFMERQLRITGIYDRLVSAPGRG